MKGDELERRLMEAINGHEILFHDESALRAFIEGVVNSMGFQKALRRDGSGPLPVEDEGPAPHIPLSEAREIALDMLHDIEQERAEAAERYALEQSAPWEPKVGEYVYCNQQIFGNVPNYTGICKIQSIHGKECFIITTLKKSQIPQILLKNLRPALPSDWIRKVGDVPTVMHVWLGGIAWDRAYNIRIAFFSEGVENDIGLAIARLLNIPVMDAAEYDRIRDENNGWFPWRSDAEI